MDNRYFIYRAVSCFSRKIVIVFYLLLQNIDNNWAKIGIFGPYQQFRNA